MRSAYQCLPNGPGAHREGPGRLTRCASPGTSVSSRRRRRERPEPGFTQWERIRRWVDDRGELLVAVCQDDAAPRTGDPVAGMRALLSLLDSGAADTVVVASISVLGDPGRPGAGSLGGPPAGRQRGLDGSDRPGRSRRRGRDRERRCGASSRQRRRNDGESTAESPTLHRPSGSRTPDPTPSSDLAFGPRRCHPPRQRGGEPVIEGGGLISSAAAPAGGRRRRPRRRREARRPRRRR